VTARGFGRERGLPARLRHHRIRESDS
jgi:hypothetical protein